MQGVSVSAGILKKKLPSELKLRRLSEPNFCISRKMVSDVPARVFASSREYFKTGGVKMSKSSFEQRGWYSPVSML
jgi:hypothetical protein